MAALIIGATGAIGKDLVEILLHDKAFQEVRIFVRRKGAFSDHTKLKEWVVDFDAPGQWKSLLEGGNVAFSCLGTTRKEAGSKERQIRVDKDYQQAFAENAYEQGVEQFVLVSSRGASAQSPFLYPCIKGELDDAVQRIPFRRTFILRPNSLIRKNTKRKSETIAVKFLSLANKIGLLRSYRPIATDALAQKMIDLAKSPLPAGVHIYAGNTCPEIINK